MIQLSVLYLTLQCNQIPDYLDLTRSICVRGPPMPPQVTEQAFGARAAASIPPHAELYFACFLCAGITQGACEVPSGRPWRGA